MYMYSAKNNAFYPLSLKENYEAAGSWPDDGKEVDEDVFSTFTNAPAGKTRVAGAEGLPAWGDIPPPTKEELVAVSVTKKTNLMAAATVAIDPLQDAVDLDMATDAEKAQLNNWKKYRVLLNRVDTSTAPDITWPVSPVET